MPLILETATALQLAIDWAAVETVLQAAVSAAVFSILFYSKNKRRKGAEFNRTKFGATVLVGIGVGVAVVLSGSPLSEASWEAQMVAYGGAVAAVEGALKAIFPNA